MDNKERVLTVDDLIVEYMIMKVQLGYKPSYSLEEFISFLEYFEQRLDVQDVLYDQERLFERFFERKKDDWSIQIGSRFVGGYKVGEEMIFFPHIEKRGDVLYATNKLSDYDYGSLNIKYMSRKEQEYIKKIISDFLERMSKRKIDVNIAICNEEKELGEVIAALFVSSIWDEYVKERIREHQWPYQCREIEEYLLNIDLAKIIKLPSIRSELLSFYKDVSKRIAVLLHNDSRLEINNIDNPYLPYSNYMSIMDGYSHLLSVCKNCFYCVSIYDNVFICNSDRTNKYSDSVITKLNDKNAKMLVRKLNKSIDNK